jgi:hypothetical protein
MPNALSGTVGGAPPAPNPQPQQAPQGGMGGNALSGAPTGAPGQPQPPQQAQAPAPTQQQTIAAMRHFSAIERELTSLLSDPDLGKADLKSKIIDGATKLVSDGILTPAQAVTQLGAVPDGKQSGGPFQQKQWVEKNFAQTIQAANAVLDHHGAAFPGQGADPAAQSTPDDHQGIMAGLTSHYQGLGGQNAG